MEQYTSTKLGELIKLWRSVEGITVRDLAAEIGTSPATLNRMERGGEIDGRTMARIIQWMLKP